MNMTDQSTQRTPRPQPSSRGPAISTSLASDAGAHGSAAALRANSTRLSASAYTDSAPKLYTACPSAPWRPALGANTRSCSRA
eukprot:CAMPEP_0206009970 /NCGR_PEP_ID=MMETSP1464-20131121/10733_1 /ASSEMBLY_ACC=CAM_ASM_001124 /TAXON_ID=119497 /ORGANISM="Exanthemachrysis gayraliae, Strain RCC1523" /LENGTH=82 /DNA_ID=CAMNT_0053383577 /DNA_START=40 /DNA_END=284 /DNA_ORIENTATION=-